MKVNLLPGNQSAKKLALPGEGISLKKLMFSFGFICLALVVCIFFINQQISDIKRQLSEIQTAWGTTEPLLKEKSLLIERKQQLNSFLGLLKGSLQSDISWADKLAALPNFIPEEVWIKDISFKKESGVQQYISFDILASVGYLSKDEELLAKINNFVDNIKKDTDFFKDFNNLSLLDINKSSAVDNQGRVMDFRLSLSSKPAQ